MKKILDIGNPRIRCYQHYAFPMAIIKSHLKEYTYLYNLFIRLVYKKNEDTCFEFDMPYYTSNIPQLFLEEKLIISDNVNIQITTCSKDELISRIKQYINCNKYVSGMWNEYYIPKKEAYQKHDYERSFLIYGYDDEERCFYFTGYLGTNIWSKQFKVAYNTFWESLVIRDTMFCMYTYEYNKSFKKSLSIQCIKGELMDYLNSTPLKSGEEYLSFGIQANRDYFKNLSNKVRMKGSLVFPPLYALYEHKNMMYERLKYLASIKAIRINEDEIERYGSISKTYQGLLAMAVKYRLSNEFSIIDQIAKTGSEMIEQEIRILSLIVSI